MMAVLDRALRVLLTLLMGVLTASVFLQVLVRFVFKYPLPWTEEISRVAFVYTIFVGATVAVRQKAHINVDVLLAALPGRAARGLGLLGDLLVAIFLLAMTWQGIAFVRATGVQVTPVMQIPFRYLYPVIPVSGALMLLFLILGVIQGRRGGGSGP